MKGKALGAAVAAMLAFGSSPAFATTTWYVSTSTGVETPTCAESACGGSAVPCKTIQCGLSKSDDGDTVLVANGTYNECVTVLPGTGVGKVLLLAQSLVEAGVAGVAIIDGASVCDVASGTPGPVVEVYDQCVFSGFGVKNGGDSGIRGFGAVTISNNVVSNSTTATSGGGIYLSTGTALTDPEGKAQLRFNTVTTNTAGFDGAGIYVDAWADGVPSLVEIDGNTIAANTAATDGALGGGLTVFTDTVTAADVSTVVITTNVLDGNTAGTAANGASVSYGGGIFAATGGGSGLGTETITIGLPGTGNFVRNNVVHGVGGGISANLQPADGATHTITVTGNDATANTADLGGGGVHALTLALDLTSGTDSLLVSRNAIVGNHALSDPVNDPFNVGGGGIYAEIFNDRTPEGIASLAVRRNDIRSNDAAIAGGGASLFVRADDDPDGDGAALPAVASLPFENNLVVTNVAGDSVAETGAGGGISVFAQAIGAQASAAVPQRFLSVIGNLAYAAGTAGGVTWDASSEADSTAGAPGAVALEFSNSILMGNDGYGLGGPILPGGSISVSIDYNDALDNVVDDYEPQLGAITGTNGNISVDPNLDLLYVPLLCSPIVDQGDPAIDPVAEPLPNGGRVNIGHLANTIDATRTFPDVNSDGAIDGIDVLGIAVAFGTSCTVDSCDPRYFVQADRDLNDLVDGDDLAFVTAFYGQSCP
jgi:hypothetical protein